MFFGVAAVEAKVVSVFYLLLIAVPLVYLAAAEEVAVLVCRQPGHSFGKKLRLYSNLCRNEYSLELSSVVAVPMGCLTAAAVAAAVLLKDRMSQPTTIAQTVQTMPVRVLCLQRSCR